jgi:hypothetical protein
VPGSGFGFGRPLPVLTRALPRCLRAGDDGPYRHTSQRSAHARFRRALATGNPLLVRVAAAELGSISLADALSICLVRLRAEPRRYGRAALQRSSGRRTMASARLLPEARSTVSPVPTPWWGLEAPRMSPGPVPSARSWRSDHALAYDANSWRGRRAPSAGLALKDDDAGRALSIARASTRLEASVLVASSRLHT